MTNPQDPEGPLAKRLAEAFVDIFKSVQVDAEDSAMQMSEDEKEHFSLVMATAGASHEAEGGGFGVIFDDDAEFDVDAFYGRVTEMFLAVHAAMDARSTGKITHFLSPKALKSIRTRILGTSPEPPAGNLYVERCKALSVRQDGGQHIVHIRIVADRAAGGVVIEYWTLKRDIGARSKAGASITRCPNCGGPIDGPDRLRCSYCQQQLCDPALDWVVDEITPEGE